jgi:8-oxo-dGTP pyrophosphatase MutT (NUDIX family)
MYKIFINEKPLLLVTKTEAASIPTNEMQLKSPYFGPKRHLFHFVDTLEKESKRILEIVVVCQDLEKAFLELKELADEQVAGGGVVRNSTGEILAIFRRDWWDLPKGKMDKGETIDQTALREVREETGLKSIQLGNFIDITYHIFRNSKGKLILKTTHWFGMNTTETNLIPQSEEDIDQAVWLTKEELLAKTPIYENIKERLRIEH